MTTTTISLNKLTAWDGNVRKTDSDILDEALLENLVEKKLERVAKSTRKEGWLWVEIRTAYDHPEWSDYGRWHPEPSPLPQEDQAEMEALNAEAEALAAVDEPTEEQQDGSARSTSVSTNWMTVKPSGLLTRLPS